MKEKYKVMKQLRDAIKGNNENQIVMVPVSIISDALELISSEIIIDEHEDDLK